MLKCFMMVTFRTSSTNYNKYTVIVFGKLCLTSIRKWIAFDFEYGTPILKQQTTQADVFSSGFAQGFFIFN